MARPLLFSEYATLRTLLPDSVDSDLADIIVKEEYFSRPRKDSDQWFNTDFYLEFVVPLPPRGRRKVDAIPIRQHSMGAELFFITDENGRPASLELLAGEAFAKSSYEVEIQTIENMISQIKTNDWKTNIRSAPFLRVFDFEQCIVFLAMTTTDVSRMVGVSASQHAGEDYCFQIRNASAERRLIEGVIYR